MESKYEEPEETLKYTMEEIEEMLMEFEARPEQVYFVYHNLNFGLEDERTKHYLRLCDEINDDLKKKYSQMKSEAQKCEAMAEQ